MTDRERLGKVAHKEAAEQMGVHQQSLVAETGVNCSEPIPQWDDLAPAERECFCRIAEAVLREHAVATLPKVTRWSLEGPSDNTFLRECEDGNLVFYEDVLAYAAARDAQIAELQAQVSGHCERIAAQSELLTKKAESPFPELCRGCQSCDFKGGHPI